MGQLKNELYAFQEQQKAFNENLNERFHSIDAKIQSLKRHETRENKESIRNKLETFEEQQKALNENLNERFHSIDAKIQSLKRQTEECFGTISTDAQIQSIRNKLETFKSESGA